MSALLWIVMGAGWLSLGFASARHMAQAWFDEFGDYDGMPTLVLIQATLMGPLGWIIATIVAPPAALSGFGAKVFGRKS